MNQTDVLPATESSPLEPSLTTNEKVGVGVGVPFGVLFGCALCGYLIYRRYQSRKNNNQTRSRHATVTDAVLDENKEIAVQNGTCYTDSMGSPELGSEESNTRGQGGHDGAVGPSELAAYHLDLGELPGNSLAMSEPGQRGTFASELDGTEKGVTR